MEERRKKLPPGCPPSELSDVNLYNGRVHLPHPTLIVSANQFSKSYLPKLDLPEKTSIWLLNWPTFLEATLTKF